MNTRDDLQEAYISVDIEASGPIPGEYSMLSLGACLVENPTITFYVKLRPINDRYVPAALDVTGFSLKYLEDVGREPSDAMSAFRDWIREVAAHRRPVFVGFNASFDWAFVNWYFHSFLRENPFGIAALDIKAYYMGLSGVAWSETTSSRLPEEFKSTQSKTHNALDDAIAQAETFKKLINTNR